MSHPSDPEQRPSVHDADDAGSRTPPPDFSADQSANSGVFDSAATGSGVGLGNLFGPLLDSDPAKIGDFWLDARAVVRPSGVGYLGRANDGTPVLLVQLSEGAADDAAARDRLAGEVNKLHVDTVVARGGQGQDQGRLGDKYRDEDDDPVGPTDPPLAPWVALAYDGSPAAVAEADRLLAAVSLAGVGALGSAAGPDYQLAWIDRTDPGRGRLWPLPWPGRHDRAGWMTILVSWLLMILLAAIALLIAVLLFQNAPPEPPQPPVPTSASQSASGGGSPSGSQSASATGSQSGSGSPTNSGSASGSTSPSGTSPGNGGEGSDHPSMESQNPTGTASGLSGESTPTNKRL